MICNNQSLKGILRIRTIIYIPGIKSKASEEGKRTPEKEYLYANEDQGA